MPFADQLLLLLLTPVLTLIPLGILSSWLFTKLEG